MTITREDFHDFDLSPKEVNNLWRLVYLGCACKSKTTTKEYMFKGKLITGIVQIFEADIDDVEAQCLRRLESTRKHVNKEAHQKILEIISFKRNLSKDMQ